MKACATSCLRVHCMNEVGGLRSVEDFWKTEEVWTVSGRDCLYVVVYLFFLDVAWTSFLRMERCELLWREMNYMVRIERL